MNTIDQSPRIVAGLVRHLLCLLCLALASGGLQAHTVLHHSSPADNEVLSEAPEELVLEFADPVNLAKLELFNGADESLPLAFETQKQAAARFALPLPALEPGVHRVEWTALGADGHVLRGSFRFELRP